MKNVTINPSMCINLKNNGIIIEIKHNTKYSTLPQTPQINIFKENDPTFPLPSLDDIYDSLKQFGLSDEDTDSLLLLKDKGVSDRNKISMGLKKTQYEQILTSIRDDVKTALLNNEPIDIPKSEVFLLTNALPESTTYREYQSFPDNIKDLYRYDRYKTWPSITQDLNNKDDNLKFILSLIMKYSQYIAPDNTNDTAYMDLEVTNNQTNVTMMPSFQFTDEGIKLNFITKACIKDTNMILSSNKIPADMLDINDLKTGEPTSFFKDLFTGIHVSEYMDHITTIDFDNVYMYMTILSRCCFSNSSITNTKFTTIPQDNIQFIHTCPINYYK